MVFHLVYKTTNLLNDKFYVGSHQTDRLEDGYLGSGVILKKALKKYGRNNFKREIIANCVSAEVSREIETIFVRYYIDNFKRQCYNRSYSGTGGMLGEDNSFFGKRHSEESLQKMSASHKGKYDGELNPFYGKKHTQETINKIKLKRPNSETCMNMRVYYILNAPGWWCTPIGCFFSTKYASEITGINENSIVSRCKNPDKFVKGNYQVPEEYWGRTWRENGFWYKRKQALDTVI